MSSIRNIKIIMDMFRDWDNDWKSFDLGFSKKPISAQKFMALISKHYKVKSKKNE
jgi:hypothetical protein